MNVLACYIRLSLADGDLGNGKDESNSIRNQRNLLHQYIESHPEFSDWTVQEFVDDGYTGTNDDRPEFQRMIDLVRQGMIQCIIVKDLSRFARNYIITGEYLEEVFPFLGVRFISITDHYDSASNTTVEDNMSVVLKSVLNAYYSKDLGRKIASSFHQRMRQGTFKSKAPYGYRRVEDQISYQLDPESAKIVRLIFDLALKGCSTREIANRLNEDKIPTPAVYNRYHTEYNKISSRTITENPIWEPTGILNILRNRAYTGDLIMRKAASVVSGSKKRRPTLPEEQIVKKEDHTPIVTHEEFEKVQNLFPMRAKRQKTRQRIEYTLKGTVRCGQCRRVMVYANYSYFVCRHSVLDHSSCSPKHFPAAEIENAVFEALKPLLETAAAAGKRTSRKNGSAPVDFLSQCRKEIADTEYRERRCRQLKLDAYEEYTAGTLSLENYLKRKDSLTKQAKEYSRRLGTLKAQEKAYSGGEIPHDVQAITDAAMQFRHNTSLTREMVTTFLESVYVYDDHYEFQWKEQALLEQLNGQQTNHTR